MLTFRTLAVLMLTKGTRSLQNRMNTFLPKLGKPTLTVDKSAYSRARRKLKHTAFIELNEEAVGATMYGDGNYQTWQGHRVLAVDGSKLVLPDNEANRKEFGTWSYWAQQKDKDISGKRTMALASVMYDVLNRVSVDARLERCDAYEVDLAKEHLKHTKENDLVIYDRGYCSFRMMALAVQAGTNFLIRGRSRRSFQVAEQMLAGKGPNDITITIKPSKNTKVKIRNEGLPTELTVRFVRVTLDTGEYEVLATSLLDTEKYPFSCFKELYYLRWGIETFYGTLKTRLHLENFTGLSPEAIRQDFFATIFLSGVESILTLDAEITLAKQKGGLPKKVNKAVSFNLIKEQAFELFYSKAPNKQRLEKLTELFLSSPTVIRKGRKPLRTENSSRQVLNFWKRQRKVVF
jgi:hypothetical protein